MLLPRRAQRPLRSLEEREPARSDRAFQRLMNELGEDAVLVVGGELGGGGEVEAAAGARVEIRRLTFGARDLMDIDELAMVEADRVTREARVGERAQVRDQAQEGERDSL